MPAENFNRSVNIKCSLELAVLLEIKFGKAIF